MPLEPFDQIFPEIARAEMRMCEVPGPGLGVPGGKYILREFYCTEEACDCRRVLVQFMPMEGRGEVAASINYGWEKAQFYRKWSNDPDLWREMAGATLEPFMEQGPVAKRFLPIFKHVIRDHSLVAAFRKHYRLVKEKTDPRMALGAP